jgi:hypothetical protein
MNVFFILGVTINCLFWIYMIKKEIRETSKQRWNGGAQALRALILSTLWSTRTYVPKAQTTTCLLGSHTWYVLELNWWWYSFASIILIESWGIDSPLIQKDWNMAWPVHDKKHAKCKVEKSYIIPTIFLWES